MTTEAQAIATFAKAMDRFEATWARYVAALDEIDALRAKTRALDGAPSHAYRALRGRRNEARRLHAILTTTYAMELGAAP